MRRPARTSPSGIYTSPASPGTWSAPATAAAPHLSGRDPTQIHSALARASQPSSHRETSPIRQLARPLTTRRRAELAHPRVDAPNTLALLLRSYSAFGAETRKAVAATADSR